MKFRALLLAGLTLLVTACASTPEGQRAERIVVQAATLRIIETAAQPSQKAQRINEAVKLARTTLLDESVTVDALRGALLKRVGERVADGKMPLSEKLVALEVINTLSDEVEKRVGSGILSPDSIVTVNTVLDWVSDATAFYVPVTP